MSEFEAMLIHNVLANLVSKPDKVSVAFSLTFGTKIIFRNSSVKALTLKQNKTKLWPTSEVAALQTSFQIQKLFGKHFFSYKKKQLSIHFLYSINILFLKGSTLLLLIKQNKSDWVAERILKKPIVEILVMSASVKWSTLGILINSNTYIVYEMKYKLLSAPELIQCVSAIFLVQPFHHWHLYSPTDLTIHPLLCFPF